MTHGLVVGVAIVGAAALAFGLRGDRPAGGAMSEAGGRARGISETTLRAGDDSVDEAAFRMAPSPAPRKDPRGARTSVEATIGTALNAVYLEAFRGVDLGDRVVRLRLPFGQDGERKGAAGAGAVAAPAADADGGEAAPFAHRILLGGKGSPEPLWAAIANTLAGEGFAAYRAALEAAGPATLRFDLEKADWSLEDPEAPDPAFVEDELHIRVPRAAGPVRPSEIYDFLYCVAGIGIDCSGFVFRAQSALAAALGGDLAALLAPATGIAAERMEDYAGLWLFDPERGLARRVDDRLAKLRPGDIFLFRGHLGEYKHSAVVLSVDRRAGELRYAQSTDWAPRPERGVHESRVLFDPGNPELRLGDPSLVWTQEVAPAFPREPGPGGWRNDGDRYRNPWPGGGSLVVRLEAVRGLVEAACPGFYATREDGAAAPR